jgi:hypothetical protein
MEGTGSELCLMSAYVLKAMNLLASGTAALSVICESNQCSGVSHYLVTYLHSSCATNIVFKYKFLMVYGVVQWLYKQIWELKENIKYIHLKENCQVFV